MAIQILVLEDRKSEFDEMVSPLNKYFANHIDVFPKDGVEKDIEHFYFFREEIVQLGKFDKIVEHYKQIDLFILDVNLLDDTDKIGANFYQYLKDVNYRNGDYKVIEVSSGPPEIKKYDVFPISKSENPFYYNMIVEKVSELFPQLVANSHVKKQNKLVSFGSTNSGVNFLSKVDKGIRWSLHGIIMLSFYILLFSSVLFATWKIGTGLRDLAFAEPHSATTQQNEVIAESKHGMEIFEPAENIFLYLLPVFILFGFYNYYKTNTSIYLLNGNKDRINEDVSTRSMNLTKMIFISTIISYLLIKIIEQIFYGEEKLDLIYRLYASGGVLILLMTFFLLMYRKH